jgi:predicted amidophosphoribosyltransferase
MTACDACGTELAAIARFCLECGTPITSVAAEYKQVTVLSPTSC